jgi:hypothetical protein
VTVGELLNFDGGRAPRQVLVQVIRQRRAVEFFANSDSGGIGFKCHECHVMRAGLNQLLSTSGGTR